MRAVRAGWVVALALAAGACAGSDHPGNDREAQLDPVKPPAQVSDAASALAGVDPGVIKPQAMTDADRHNVPEGADRCVFHFTQEGQPIVTYGEGAVVKLNGKLVLLPAIRPGEFGGDRVTVVIRPFEEPDASETVEAEFVLRVAGAPHERGHRGFLRCGAGGS